MGTKQLLFPFFVLFTFIHKLDSSEIYPTISNSSGNFYITRAIETFSNDDINCPSNSTNCYIFCEYSNYDCSSLTINASLVENLYVICGKDYSCKTLDIVSASSYLAQIDCISYRSCDDMSLKLINTDNVYLTCNDSTTTNRGACWSGIVAAPNASNFYLNCASYDCSFLWIDITYVDSVYFVFDAYGAYGLRIDAAQIPNNLTLPCDKDHACQGMEVKCPFDSYCNIDCGADYSGCYDAKVYIMDYTDDLSNNYLNMDCGDDLENQVCQPSNMNCLSSIGYGVLPEQDILYMYKCSTSGCCPTVTDIINCTQYVDNHCIINCTAEDHCDNALIDPIEIEVVNNMTIDNLTVHCHQCEGSLIICPSVGCNINCENCRGSYFIAQYTKRVDILCYSSCGSAIIKMHNVDVFNIECTGSSWLVCDQLTYVDIHHIKSFNMLCSSYIGCNLFHIKDAMYIDEFNLKCDGDGSTCGNSVINIKNVNNVNLECTDASTCSRSVYNIQNVTNNVNILCTNTSSCQISKFNIIGNDNYNVSINVICAIKDCESSTFDFSYVDTINFVCENERSCYLATIYGNISNEFNLHCLGTGYPGSCFGSNVHPSSLMRQSTNIYCGESPDTCDYLDVFVPSTFYPNYVKLNCANSTFCTDGLTFECIDLRYKYYGYAKSSDIVFPSVLSMNYTDASYGCTTNRCCPWTHDETVFCNEYDVECIINCSADTNKCINKYIYASNITTSLTVICDSYQSCSWAVVNCPNNEGATCNVECTANQACQHLRVEYDHYSTIINVSCASSDVYHNKINICDYLNIFAFNATNINFECIEATCDEVFIHGLSADYINVNCLSQHNQSENAACIHLTIEGYNVSSQINLECIGYRSCHQPYLNVYYAQSVYIYAAGDYSIYYGDIRAFYVSSFVLNCASQISDIACINPNIYLPAFNIGNVDINCYGTGCFLLNLFDIYGIWNHTIFYLNECGQCMDLGCASVLNVHCNAPERRASNYPYSPPYDFGSYNIDTKITNNICDDDNICSCDDITNTFIGNHVNDHTDDLCVMAPTMNPTIDPTVVPTAIPTSLPSMDPTYNPSASPTPLTIQPSFNPTHIPSSANPTSAPSMVPTLTLLEITQVTDIVIKDDETDKNSVSWRATLTTIAIVVLIVLILGTIIGYCWCNRTKQPDGADIPMNKPPQIVQVVQLVPVGQLLTHQDHGEATAHQQPKIEAMNSEPIGREGKQQPITYQ